MKNILVPTDLSEVAENGLKVAVEIAGRIKSTIYLVNFIKHPFGSTFTATGDVYTKYADNEDLYTVQLIRKHKADMEEIAGKYKTAGINIKTIVYDDEIKDGIDSFIDEYAIDLIVMGTTGEENITEKFTGNHVGQVLAQANCPVISVRENYVHKDIQYIVVGWDMDDQTDYKKAISYINDLSDVLQARTDVVYVTKPGTKDRDNLSEKLKSFASDHRLTNYSLHIVENDDVEDGILNYAHKVQAGMIVMLSRAKGGMARLFTHSSSEDMSKESDIPVYTINLHNV